MKNPCLSIHVWVSVPTASTLPQGKAMEMYGYVSNFSVTLFHQVSDIVLPQIWIISQRRVSCAFRHGIYIDGLHFSPNGQCVATCSGKTVRIWRLRDGSSRVITDLEFYPWSVRFSPDGRYITSGCSPQQICMWNSRTQKLVVSLHGKVDYTSSLVVHS